MLYFQCQFSGSCNQLWQVYYHSLSHVAGGQADSESSLWCNNSTCFFFPKSFLMLPSGKLKLPSNWLIVYTVICCVNISGCYMKYASFPTFWKTHGARMFPQFLANGTRIVDSWPKWDKHHCRLRYMYESSLHCLPNQWWQWSIACMCAFTFICLHIYICIYFFSLAFMMFAALLALLDVTVSSTHIGRFFFLSGLCNGWLWCMRMHGLNHSSLESKFPFNAKLPNVCMNAQSTWYWDR